MKEHLVLLVLGLSLIQNVYNSNPDEIHRLPGLIKPPNFKQYSGYLNATGEKMLHYWFVESQKSPTDDPVVLWMNGGPGCSSLDGLLNELGPFHVKEDGKTLYDNPYSWNKVANVIFLEAPAGVGFSFSKDGQYSTDDDQAAKDNYVALQHFFMKFPHLKKNDFYVAGESYGGIYVPTLSVKILSGPAKINLKGFAVGNGFLSRRYLGNSLVFFAYYHGLVGKELWNILIDNCCHGNVSEESCNFVDSKNLKCTKGVEEITKLVWSSGLNIYNLYEDCISSSDVKYSRSSVDQNTILKLLRRKPSYSTKSPPCVDSTNIEKWLNQPEVRSALHIPSFVQKWTICSNAVEAGYKNIYDTMKPQVLQLIKSGQVKGLVYNGDVDMACNFLGDEWFVDNLHLKIKGEFRNWKFGDQIAGFVKEFDNLTFVTIKGSGHMVPQDKPGPAFKMITNFLFNKPF
ncbi:lysosomal protective protein-like [Limulus polyphemus]|uniref:Carboxypeptidase n=1 Tax=Limulus polyphemus TaxID=6850 RepID=A0ABM1BLU7_LIMPO|nr:lysosomal protective protein-like [Limulus polyphemus]XP_013784601.1 lysosomal protective protein-like [Limulus polyphemus]XP_013784602.1 lysosomal protective protein-like [Limulus polyphemus]XP_013784603.1 lysosomal protective protein-like [Limulus polyphemus]XP_022252776.1 lysosomal protective protein-like [Limulus polyphemus]XP_022252777.1 lysosomal protective protein-like [Limulus polyphemus]XP_022252778.1 lysosomal protective protein-like [Limulus polyphemus]